MKVYLTDEELEKAKYIADRWDTTTGKYKIKWKQLKKNVYRDTLNGIKYEMVVAKYFGFEYDGDIGKPGRFDVGGKYEVRGTKYINGHLILNPEDKDAIYILVVGDGNEFDIVGWIDGKEGKKDEYWRTDTRYPCYFVPQSALKNIELLT